MRASRPKQTALFSHRSEAFFKVGDDVVDVLRADRQANGVRADAARKQLLFRQLRMRRRRGMDHKRLDVRDVCQQREDLQRVDESVGFLLPALDVEGEDGRTSVGEVFLEQCVIGMVGQ